MSRLGRLALLLAAVATAADAQPIGYTSGTIVFMVGDEIGVRDHRGTTPVLVEDRTEILYARTIARTQIKPGDFVSVRAHSSPGYSLAAIEVRRFPKPIRPGHGPSDGRFNETMTNGTVEAVAQAVNGPELTVTYPGGSQKILVGGSASVSRIEAGKRSQLKYHQPVQATFVKESRGFVALMIQIGPTK